MTKIELFKNKHNIYQPKKDRLQCDVDLIIAILLEDCPCFEIFLEWLENKEQKNLYNNLCEYKKQGENIIVSYLDYSGKDEDIDECSLTMKRIVFEDMIKQWIEKVVTKRPTNIKIIVKKDSVKIETEK